MNKLIDFAFKEGNFPIKTFLEFFEIWYFSSHPWVMESPRVPLVSKSVNRYGQGRPGQANMNYALLYGCLKRL